MMLEATRELLRLRDVYLGREEERAFCQAPPTSFGGTSESFDDIDPSYPVR